MFGELVRSRDVEQLSLWAAAAPSFSTDLPTRLRSELGGGAWVDAVPGWFVGSGALFDEVRGDGALGGTPAGDVGREGRRAAPLGASLARRA